MPKDPKYIKKEYNQENIDIKKTNDSSLSQVPVGVVTFTDIFEEKTTHQEVKEKVPHEITYEVPDVYGDDRIILMVRDPFWIHAYWESTEETREEVRRQINHGEQDNLKYVLRVHTLTDTHFSGTDDEYFDIEVDESSRNWYVNVPKPNKAYRVDLGFLTAHSRFFSIARSNVVTTPREGVSDVIDEEWMIIEDEYKKMYRIAAGYGIGDSSIEIMESIMERHRREMGSIAISSISSPAYVPDRIRPFWLKVDTELIVYGATEPGANVTIQGTPVKLRPDGSFTARFALPNGTQEIPVKAVSQDENEARQITPVISKHTK